MCLPVDMQCHEITLCLTSSEELLEELPDCFPKSAAPLYTFSSIVGGFRYLHILTSACYIVSFCQNLCEYEVVSHCSLVFISLMTTIVQPLFVCSWPFKHLFWRNVCLNPLPIFKLGCLFIIEFLRVLFILWIMNAHYRQDTQTFSPILWGCLSSFRIVFFDIQKLLISMKSNLFIFFC